MIGLGHYAADCFLHHILHRPDSLGFRGSWLTKYLSKVRVTVFNSSMVRRVADYDAIFFIVAVEF